MTRKNIIVSGVTSGFGNLISKELLDDGHRIVAIARGGKQRLLKTPLEPYLSKSSQLLVIDLDLKNRDYFETAAQTALHFLDNKIDVLINNAGLGYIRPLFSQNFDEIKEQMDVNYLHLIEWTRLYFESLKANHGRIIQISSIAGLSSFPFYGAYSASKHALEAASEALYYELKPFNIQVTLVEPGGFQTAFTSKALTVEPKIPSDFIESEKKLSHFFKTSKNKWTKSPEPVVRLIKRLCFQKKISLRYRIGSDAQFLYFLKLLLPENLRVRLIAFLYRKYFFGA